MKALNHTCQGASHIKVNKVCQDASYSFSSESMSVAIVSDGHGGDSYFRSDVGSRSAVEATRECVEAFVKDVDKYIFSGKPFTERGANTSNDKGDKADETLRRLFNAIVTNWRMKINAHKSDNPLTEEEKSKLDPKSVADFEADVDLEKTYGCTLMCYVCTPDFFFAFHVGDGKCIAFKANGKWFEPIPWDNNCFLNKTTSLCDSKVFDEFRFCYCGDGTSPIVVFLGSDGIDDTFGPTENMVDFYVKILKELNEKGVESTLADLQSALPTLSAKGSKDDMSVACVFDDSVLPDMVPHLVDWQRQNVKTKISKINTRIQTRMDDVVRFNGEIPKRQKLQDIITKTKNEQENANLCVSKCSNIVTCSKEEVKRLQSELDCAKKKLDSANVALSDANKRSQKLAEDIKQHEDKLRKYQRLQIDIDLAKKELSRAFDEKRSLANEYDNLSKEIQGESFTPYNDDIGFAISPSADKQSVSTEEDPISTSNDESSNDEPPHNVPSSSNCAQAQGSSTVNRSDDASLSADSTVKCVANSIASVLNAVKAFFKRLIAKFKSGKQFESAISK